VDRIAAAKTYKRLLGAEVMDESASAYLGAKRTILAVGESRIELCEPDGSGLTADFISERGEGLMTAGLSTHNPEGLRLRLMGLGVEPVVEGEQFYLSPEKSFGVHFVISPMRPRPRIGPLSFLYEVTNSLVSSWQSAAAHYAGLFGLDPCRFSIIRSKRFGYEGALTLFNPPDRLDRIELSQVVNAGSAMGRWVGKHGDSLYMCYCETHNLSDIISRLQEAGARWAPRGERREDEQDGLWVHPGELHGLLLGISRTMLAWEWSGRPELVRPLPDQS